MWTSLVTNSGMKRVLPTGQNWILSKQVFDRKSVQLELVGHSSGDTYLVNFEPIYWAISDEWVEAYGNIQKDPTHSLNLSDVRNTIENTWPEQSKHYDNMEAYYINAMEWDIRFISNAKPIVEKKK